MNVLKKGMYVLSVSCLIFACSSDDDDMSSGGGSSSAITNVDFTTAASGDGTVIAVTPTATGGTSFSVDFGTDATDDVLSTAGAPVSYDYPNTTANYTIKVTAMADGKDPVSTEKSVAVNFNVPQTDVVGRWVLLHEAGALGIGPAADNFSWWSNNLADVNTRACLFDDVYEFKADGTFVNTVGNDTWLENSWIPVTDEGCATALAPFDGSATSGWFHDEAAGTITITGKGGFLGLAKVINGTEIDDVANASESITYSNVTFSEDKNTMTVQITVANAGGADGKNAYWQFKFAKEGSAGASIPQTDTDGDGVIDAEDECPTVAGTEPNGCPPSGIGVDPMDDFEGNGNVTWEGDAAGVEVVDNQWKVAPNTSNKVLKYTDDGGQYANIRFDLNADKTDKFDLSTKSIFKVMVYVPTPAVAVTQPKQLALKLQDGSSAQPWEGQVEVIQTYEYDTWQELTFDFSAYSAETKFSRVVVQFNSENNFESVVGYLDNLTYGAN